MFIKVRGIGILTSILGFHNILKFDPNSISIISYDCNNSILKPILSPPIVKIDNCKGVIDFNIGRKESYIGFSEGVLYKLRCKAKINGCTIIHNNVADLRDYSGGRIFTEKNSLNLRIL